MASPPLEKTPSIRSHLPLLLVALGASVLMVVWAAPAGAEVVDIPVPYHRQVESWYCAEASLQMVFDYWGEDIPQHDIGDVANERQVGGTYATDLARAARFSNLSTAIQARELGGARLQGYDQRNYGYSAHVNQWKGSGQLEHRYTDLMDLVRAGYPVILLCWLDIEHEVTHFRVVKGFDTDTGDFLVHDPALGSSLRFNMTLLVDDLWTYYDRWGMVVVPWRVEVGAPAVVGPGEVFEVEATVTYPCPPPFDASEKVYTWPQDPRVTVTVPPPFSLAPGENASAPLNISRGGDSDVVTWTLVAPVEPGYWSVDLVVRAEALVTDTAISYGWYQDTAGGEGQATVGCDALPPEVRTFSVAGGESLVADPTVAVAYDTNDGHSGVEEVSLSVDGGVTWRRLEGRSGGLDVDLEGGDGAYQLVLRVVDAVDNTATRNASVVLDTTPPRIQLLRLAGGSDIVTSARVQVELEALDDTTSIEGLSVRVGNAPWSTWRAYQAGFMVDLPTDGTHVVEVRLRDAAGNLAAASDQLVLDTTAPLVLWFEVAGGLSFTRTSTVPVSLSASDALGGVLGWSIHEDGAGQAEFLPGRVMGSGDVLTMDWTLLGEGPTTLVLTVRDEAGHTDDARVSLVVDTQPPGVVMVLNGGREVTTVSDIPVAITVSDLTTEVVRARIRVNSNEWGPWSDPGAFRRVDLGPEDGLRTVHVQAQDQAGNMAEASATVLLDSTAPTVSVSFTSTRPGGVVMGDSELVLTFSEPMDAASVEVLLMDNSSGLMECHLAWSGDGKMLTVDPEGVLPRGSHFVLTVSGEDLVGNPLEFRGVLFSTPEGETEDWDTVLPGGPRTLLLLLVLLVVAVAIGAYAARSRRGR